MSRFIIEDSKITIKSAYEERRKPTVGDVVRYWRPTGEAIDDVKMHIGTITECSFYTRLGVTAYTIDHQYVISEKDIIGLALAEDYYRNSNPVIKKVIFNPPATIVLWTDGTKTVVKAAEGDEYSKWAGLALCMAKKQLGDDFHKVFKKWCKDEEEEEFDGYDNPFLDALYRSFLDINGRPYSDTGTARSCNCANSYLKKEKKNEKGE